MPLFCQLRLLREVAEQSLTLVADCEWGCVDLLAKQKPPLPHVLASRNVIYAIESPCAFEIECA